MEIEGTIVKGKRERDNERVGIRSISIGEREKERKRI